MNEIIIYSDESEKEGKYYSNFYGGVMVRAKDFETIVQTLNDSKQQNHLFQELKWTKVTENYVDKYCAFMDVFFSLVAQNKAKVRIMFTQNVHVPKGLTKKHIRNAYHILYYQFIKHAFGLPYCTHELQSPVRVRLNIDQMPQNREQNEQFKSYLISLNRNPSYKDAGIFIDREQIAEIDSKNHVLLQCVDVILGAMAFRLNDKHLQKPDGQLCRGKRTLAKEKLYKHILQKIRQIYPGFNIGCTTGKQARENIWSHPYRHWLFVPKNSEIDTTQSKK